jgi:hypothetical protein
MTLIGPSVSKEWDYPRNASSGVAETSIRKREQLKHSVVRRRRERLHKEHLFAAHRLVKLHRNVAVRISVYRASADLGT